MKEIADVLDELAGDLKALSRQPTTGSTESQILGSMARVMTKRAALHREADIAAGDADERRQAALAAAAPATLEAGPPARPTADTDLVGTEAMDPWVATDPPAADPPAGYDPAEHTINEVNDHLASASPQERERIIYLERQDRSGVPENKKMRTGILSGPFGEDQEKEPAR